MGVLILAAVVVAASVLRPMVSTEPVTDDADDPAIWVCAADPAKSLVFGTNKAAAPVGALVVFGLDGKTRQVVSGIDRPNNVDVEYGFRLADEDVDIAVLTERQRARLRVFRIPRDGGAIADVSSESGLVVFEGEPADRAEPMGVALYRRASDGAVFAIVSRKRAGVTGYLWQYRLEDDGRGRVKAAKVRELGPAGAAGEIEAVAVDDALGYIYFAEEGLGIHKWHADPAHADAGRELALFGRDGFRGDREGIAIYDGGDGAGYLICTDQVAGGSRYHLYPRHGTQEHPHEHPRVRIVEGGADETDGLDAVARPLGTAFPEGLVVAMNSAGRNFFYYEPAALSLRD